MRRRLAREVALKALFQIDLAQQPLESAMQFAVGDDSLDASSHQFAQELVLGVMENKSELDKVITEHAVGWTVRRMAVVDRNILRLGCYELVHSLSLPARVAINEAVELAKKYGNADSAKFINGVLGTVARQAVGTE